MDFEMFEELELKYIILRDIKGTEAGNPTAFLGNKYDPEKALSAIDELRDEGYILVTEGKYTVTEEGKDYRKGLYERLNEGRGVLVKSDNLPDIKHVSPVQVFPGLHPEYIKRKEKGSGSVVLIILGSIFFLLGLFGFLFSILGFIGSVLLPIGIFTPRRLNYCPKCNIAKNFDQNCPKCGLTYSNGCLRAFLGFLLGVVLSAITLFCLAYQFYIFETNFPFSFYNI